MFKLYFKLIEAMYAKNFKKSCEAPLDSQYKLLISILKENKNTLYGKKYSFSEISSFDSFRKNVPLVKYSDIASYIDTIKDGGTNILTKKNPSYFSETAGTTSSPKYLPLSESYVKKRSRAWKIWESELFNNHPDAFQLDKKIITFTSKPIEGISKSGISYGNVSGLIRSIQPKIVNSLYAVPEEIMYVDDYHLRYYLIALFSLRENCSLVVTPNPSTLVVFAKFINENFQQILRDYKYNSISQLEKSTLENNLKNAIFKKFENQEKNQQAYYSLKNLQNNNHKLHEIFGNITIGTWTSGSVGYYISQLKEAFGDEIYIKEIGFMASEGRFSIPMAENDFGESVFDITTNFYEFIEVENYRENDPNQDTLLIHELELGKQYYIILTNQCGLYRYQIDDIVEITGIYRKTPTMKFVQKGKYVASLTGEKVSEWEIIESLKQTQQELGLPIKSFICVPEHKKEGVLYNFYIHENSYSKKELNLISKTIDTKLISLNIEYEQKRKSLRILPCNVQEVPHDFFMDLRKSYAKGGKHDYQIKVPKLIVLEKDKVIVEKLLKGN